MKNLLLFLVALGFSTLLLADDIPENLWSDYSSLNTATLPTVESPLTIKADDEILYSAKWAAGYDRTASIVANATGVSQLPVFTSELEAEGFFTWDYSTSSETELPRDLVYSLVNEIKDQNGNVLETMTCYVKLESGDDGGGDDDDDDDDDPPTIVWSEKSLLDTKNIAPGKVLTLLPTDPITYSTKWLPGENRKLTIQAMVQDHSSTIPPYNVMTSGLEFEGTYCWDYSQESSEVLPTDELYTLSYSVFNDTEFFGSENAVVTIALLPEPGMLLGLLALSLLLIRKK